jgi:hypothetical protein
MLFPFLRKNPLFVNIVLNDYIKNSEYKYMEIIKKNIENINTNKKKEKIFGEEEPNSLIIIPSVVFLSLTTIIHYFYSLIC